MNRIARSRVVLTAMLSAALMSLGTAIAVFASGSNGPFPK